MRVAKNQVVGYRFVNEGRETHYHVDCVDESELEDVTTENLILAKEEREFIYCDECGKRIK